MLDLGTRKLLQKSKGGALLNVPVVWLRSQNLRVGDKVHVVIGLDQELILRRCDE